MPSFQETDLFRARPDDHLRYELPVSLAREDRFDSIRSRTDTVDEADIVSVSDIVDVVSTLERLVLTGREGCGEQDSVGTLHTHQVFTNHEGSRAPLVHKTIVAIQFCAHWSPRDGFR